MPVSLPKRLFDVNEYHRMGDEGAGIFDEDSNVELLEGVVWEMHPPRRHKYSIEEFNSLIEAGILAEDENVELIKGEIVQMSPIGNWHQACVDRLTALFGRFAGPRTLLRVQGPIELPDYSQMQPDVALLKPREDFYADSLPRPADVLLVVEVAETSLKYDREINVPLYAGALVSEIWLIDLKKEVVEVHTEPANGDYQVVRQVRRGELLAVGAVPGLSVAVADVLG